MDQPQQSSQSQPAAPQDNEEDVQKIPKKSEMVDKDPQKDSKRAAVKMWLGKVKNAKKKYESDFKRMESDIAFAVGYQRTDQSNLDIDEYTCNLVLRNINQKVAALYARNPTAEFQKRKRLNYQLWDGKMESIQPLAMRVAMSMNGIPTQPLMPQEMALIQDYIQGEQNEAGLDKIGKSLQITYQYQIDEHDPDFKLQMKSLVRRVCTCGVGFVRMSFVREVNNITTEGMGSSITDQAKKLHLALEQLDKENHDTNSPKNEQIKNLLTSMQASLDGQADQFELAERLSFDFLPPTSIIVDENCRNLKGFVGARFIALEYILPLDEINAYFETDIKPGGDIKLYKGDGKTEELNKGEATDESSKPKGCVIEILDKGTKTHFFVLDGYKDYLQEPAPLDPPVKGFWPVFTLMFNDVESVPGGRATIYPPSDVFLMRHPQKEWNRSRESLRRQRNANAAKYLTQKGMLTEADKDKLENAEENAVIEIEGQAPNGDVGKMVTPMEHAPIDPQCYDTAPLVQDILLSVGAQEANLGPPNPKGTATGQSIAEQSRSLGISSNVDDLDDFLSLMAAAGGEMLMQDMSDETFHRIVGPGCAMPPQGQRADFLNQIYLKVAAASSGRPNKMIELQNWQMIAPVLQAAGANPQFMVRETIKRVDDRLDPQEAFPLTPPALPQGGPTPTGGGAGNGSKGGRGQPAHRTGAQPPQQGRPGPGKQSPQGQPMAPAQPPQ